MKQRHKEMYGTRQGMPTISGSWDGYTACGWIKDAETLLLWKTNLFRHAASSILSDLYGTSMSHLSQNLTQA